MAVTVAELVARLRADTSDFVRGMGDAQRSVVASSQSLGNLGKSMQDVGRRLSLTVSAPLAAAGFAAFRELQEAGKQAAITQAHIKSTGGAANVTAKHVDDLANSLARMSGVDDELIKTGENMLLTFRKVHNEAGRGNDIFDRATKAALDLSLSGFGTIDSAAKQLGKALNDPIAGMTALTKAGVTFDAQQKATIRALVESGDLLGAQKLILKEVEAQVGGTAKMYGQTLAGNVGRAKEALLNAAGAILSTAGPAFNFIAAGAEKFAAMLQSLPGPLQGVVGGLAAFAAAAGPVLWVVGSMIRNFATVKSAVQPMIDAMGGAKNAVMGLFGAAGILAGAAGFGMWLANVTGQAAEMRLEVDKAADAMSRLTAAQALNFWTEMTRKIAQARDQLGPAGIPSDLEIFRQVAQRSVATAQALVLAMEQNGQATGRYKAVLEQEIAAQARSQVATEKSSKAVQDHVNKLNSVPPSKHTTVTASLDWASVAGVERGLAGLVRTRTASIFANLGSQFRQFGGPVFPGRPYIVGEKRPELFVPNTAGRIVPSVPSGFGEGGGGGTQNISIHVAGSVMTERQLIDVVREGLRRGERRGAGSVN